MPVRWRSTAEVCRLVLFTAANGAELPAIVCAALGDGRLVLAVLTPNLSTGAVTLTGRLAAFDENGAAGTWRWPPFGKTYADREEVPV